MFPLNQLFRRIGRFEQIDVIRESVDEVYSRVDFSLDIRPINDFLDWKSLRTKKLVYKGSPLLSNENEDNLSLNDKLSCFVSLSLLLENQQLAKKYWDQAFQEDPVQAVIIYFILTGSMDQRFHLLIEQELKAVAQKCKLSTELRGLLGTDTISELDFESLAECFVGLMGQKKKTEEPRSLSWRSQALHFWLFTSLLQEDQKLGERKRFRAIYQYNPLYARVCSAVVNNETASLDLARAQQDFLVAADTLYYRLNPKMRGKEVFFQQFYPFLDKRIERFFRRWPLEVLEAEDVTVEVLLLLIDKSYYKLDTPFHHSSPIANIQTIIKNGYLDVYKKERRQKGFDSKGKRNQPKQGEEYEDFDDHVEQLDEKETKLGAVFEILERYRVSARVAYCLFEGANPERWVSEFSAEMNKPEETIRTLCAAIIEHSDNTELRNDLVVQLFSTPDKPLKFNSIYRKYMRLRAALKNAELQPERETI